MGRRVAVDDTEDILVEKLGPPHIEELVARPLPYSADDLDEQFERAFTIGVARRYEARVRASCRAVEWDALPCRQCAGLDLLPRQHDDRRRVVETLAPGPTLRPHFHPVREAKMKRQRDPEDVAHDQREIMAVPRHFLPDGPARNLLMGLATYGQVHCYTPVGAHWDRGNVWIAALDDVQPERGGRIPLSDWVHNWDSYLVLLLLKEAVDVVRRRGFEQ